MTDKRKAPDAPDGRRKRTAPTIDLTATEVSPAADASAKPESPPPVEPSEPAQAEPPPRAEQAHGAAEEPPPAEQEAAPHFFHRHIGRVYTTAIAAGFAGAAIAAAMLAALWSAGLLPSGSDTDDQDAAIATLQKQVKELQSRPAPAAAPDNQAVAALSQTVRKLESDIAKLPRGDAAAAARLTAIDNAMNALGVEIAALGKRSDTIAAKADQAQQSAAAVEKAVADLRGSVQQAARQASSAVEPGQIEALQKRVAALEQSVRTTREDVAKASATDKSARLALSAASLRDAVAGGQPYRAELAQAQSLGADEKELAPLAQFASAGLPRKAALAQELRALIPALLKASGAQAAPAGFLERLEANANKIVRVSPVNAPQGDAPSDVLARLEIDAADDDIDGALADLAKLPDAARAPARAWIAKAKARNQALAAARQFAANSARALGQTPSADALKAK